MTDWNELVGERILVYMTPYSTSTFDLVVSEYVDGYVSFKNHPNSYGEDHLRLHLVYRSEKFPQGYVWDK